MIPAMRKYLIAVGAALVLLSGCSSESGEQDQREVDCASFARVEPGFLEIKRDTAILSDPEATQVDRSEAFKRQLDAQAGIDQRKNPYDCDDPADRELFDMYTEEQSAD